MEASDNDPFRTDLRKIIDSLVEDERRRIEERAQMLRAIEQRANAPLPERIHDLLLVWASLSDLDWLLGWIVRAQESFARSEADGT